MGSDLSLHWLLGETVRFAELRPLIRCPQFIARSRLRGGKSSFFAVPTNPFRSAKRVLLTASAHKKIPHTMCEGFFYGADSGNRTHDLFITSEPLYRLSHISIQGARCLIPA